MVHQFHNYKCPQTSQLHIYEKAGNLKDYQQSVQSVHMEFSFVSNMNWCTDCNNKFQSEAIREWLMADILGYRLN